MKEQLKTLAWTLLGVSILPIAKLCSSLLVALVKKSPRPEDDAFLKALASDIINKL